MNLYDGYCYSTIQLAAQAEINRPPIAANVGLVAATSFASSSATDGVMTYSYRPLSNGTQTNYTMTRTYPVCTQAGYLTNYSGLTVPDVVTTSWLVVACWVAAWSIKHLMRGR